MRQGTAMGACGWISWVAGILCGILAYWVSVGSVTWLPALLIGIAVAAFVGLVLGKFLCGWAMTGHDGAAPQEAGATAASGAAEAGPMGMTAMAAGTVATPEADADADAGAPLAADAADAAPAPAAAAASAAEPDPDGGQAGTEAGTRPEALSGPRGGRPDNLKEIKGIGPKLEKLCNALGFYHFDQIAGWSAEEVAWVDANLQGFKGRVTRDDWVGQARILATGGETEFSQRVDKGEVYRGADE